MITPRSLSYSLGLLCMKSRIKLLPYFAINKIWPCSRHVSTLTPLANAFNSRPQRKLNLNIYKDGQGLFGIDELSNPIGFYLLKQRAETRTDELVSEACSKDRKRKIVDVFDDLSDELCKVADLAEFVRLAHPDSQYCEAAEDACMGITALVERLNTTYELYSSLKRVVENGDVIPTTESDDHVSRLFLFDFEQCGIHLDDATRAKVLEINEYMLHVSSEFVQGSSDYRTVPKDRFPSNITEYFQTLNDGIVVSNLHAESANPLIREIAYKIYLQPDPKQLQRLEDLLEMRHRLAKLCGFKTYAHRTLRGSLAGSPETVSEFLEKLSANLKPIATAELHRLSESKANNTINATKSDIRPWDVPYYTSLIRQESQSMSIHDLAPYFSLGACMEGLCNITKKLFGVTLVLDNTEPGELWAYDVYKLAVVHETNGFLGNIYCDFFERPSKPNQDCHFTIRGGRYLPDGTYQNPIVVLVLNFPAPSWNTPSLLNPSSIDNLFHEMGHALHSMLGRTRHQHVTGTRCSTDFAEIPSILMEYFSSDPRVLCSMGKHYKTGEPVPESQVVKMCDVKSKFAALDTQLQLFYAMVDQRLHSQLGKESGWTTDVLKETQNAYYVLPHVDNTAWQLRFSHLAGYGAKYYCYLMSRAVASAIWGRYFKADPFSRESGERYYKEFLMHGGSVPARDIVEGFLGSEMNAERLADSLACEIKGKL